MELARQSCFGDDVEPLLLMTNPTSYSSVSQQHCIQGFWTLSSPPQGKFPCRWHRADCSRLSSALPVASAGMRWTILRTSLDLARLGIVGCQGQCLMFSKSRDLDILLTIFWHSFNIGTSSRLGMQSTTSTGWRSFCGTPSSNLLIISMVAEIPRCWTWVVWKHVHNLCFQ